jgi:hypothetical protein
MPFSGFSAASLSFISRSFAAAALAFSPAAVLSSCAWMAFSIEAAALTFECGVTENTFQ